MPIPHFPLVMVYPDKDGQFRVMHPDGFEQVLGADSITVHCGEYSFEVSRLESDNTAKFAWEFAPVASQGLSMVIHGALLLSLLMFTPSLLGTEEGEISQEDLYWLKAQLTAEAEKEPESKPGVNQGAGGSGDPIALSTTSPTPGKGPASLAGSGKGQGSPPASREEALADARDFGMVALLGSLPGPKEGSPWGTAGLGGGGELADAWGWGNDLELSGTGESGGDPGNWQGKYLGSLDICTTQPCAGFSRGILPSTYRPHDPKPPRQGPVETIGKIPPEVIQRVVRQSFGRFRGCYEAGLRTNPGLAGRVVVGFTVGRDGAVVSAQSAGSDLPDPSVISCVVKGFYGLSFPAPEAGVVRVTYPIVFSPQ